MPRYRCRDCHTTFSELTGTPLARLRRRDRLETYANNTRAGLGVRPTAQSCGLSPGTVQRWRHRIVVEPVAEKTAKPVVGIISLFSGLGALDLGLESAGPTVLAVEKHLAFAEAFTHARKTMGLDAPPVVVDDVGALLGDHRGQLAEALATAREKFGMAAIVGGPPCPDFSIAGKQAGPTGVNGRLTEVFFDVVLDAKPDVMIFENVKGLVSTSSHREFYDGLKVRLRDGGYALTDRLLNALDYGVAQDRERIFLIGFSKKSFVDADGMAEQFDWTAYAEPVARDVAWPTAGPFAENGRRCYPRRMTARHHRLTVDHWFSRNETDTHLNAAHHFEPRSGLPRMRTVPEGDTSRKSYKRLHRYRYSPTAAYGNNEVHLHPYLPRRLSAAEAMAIQSFPAEFSLPPTMTLSDMFKSIGNAVPFLLAKAIGKSLADCLRTAARHQDRPPCDGS